MQIDIPYINIAKKFNISLYSKEDDNYFNDYNILTKNNINLIKDLYDKNDFFVVPFVINKTIWGEEKIFYPFTTKLIKILNSNFNNLSIQLHPLKEESWIVLNDTTKIFNKNKWINLEKYSGVKIQRNLVHSLSKNSLVLEIQDNNPFDKNETIRLYDFSNRKTNKKSDYYKYLLVNHQSKLKYINYNEYDKCDKNNDYLVFILEGCMKIKYNNNVYLLSASNDLFFIKKGFEILSKDGIVLFIKNQYYKY